LFVRLLVFELRANVLNIVCTPIIIIISVKIPKINNVSLLVSLAWESIVTIIFGSAPEAPYVRFPML